MLSALSFGTISLSFSANKAESLNSGGWNLDIIVLLAEGKHETSYNLTSYKSKWNSGSVLLWDGVLPGGERLPGQTGQTIIKPWQQLRSGKLGLSQILFHSSSSSLSIPNSSVFREGGCSEGLHTKSWLDLQAPPLPVSHQIMFYIFGSQKKGVQWCEC